MTRTSLSERRLPVYTHGEELFNMITHIVGGAVGVCALVLCVIFSAIHHDGYALASSIIYGVSMITLYTMSAIYHGLSPRHDKAKKIFQIMDHCTIFLLIAGTYTPVLLCAIRPYNPQAAWTIFAIVWGACVIGIILNAIDLKRFKVFSMICYLAMGWCIIFKFNLLPVTIGYRAIRLLVYGGLCYTVGTVFYGLQKKHRYMHCIWHLWILAGSIFQFMAILLYVI